MTIDEAIDELEEHLQEGGSRLVLKKEEAIKLGIEALKRIKEARQEHRKLGLFPLPGETKD